jgi:septum formation protein
MSRVVLASASPRRLELLVRLGISVQVRVPDIDETPIDGEDPVAYVRRLAIAKAGAVDAEGDELVIAADTTVDVAGQILEKPLDAAEARSMLRRLSGRTHLVHTGVAVRRGDEVLAEVGSTSVTFAVLDEAMIDWYLATGEPFGKAGAYAIQGAGGVLVRRIDGSVSNVVGLPLDTTIDLARRCGIDLLAPPTDQH